MLYKAFGEQRHSSGTTPTDYRYTGQLEQASIGLYYYGARWYDPALGRFVSPDTIVPLESQGVQAWDRYAYVNNSPVNHTDPSGHMISDGCSYEGCSATEGEIYRDYVRNIIHNNNERQENAEKVEKGIAVIKFIGSIVYEPLDWAITASDCVNGNCSPYALMGLLPFIPSSAGKYADDASNIVYRVIKDYETPNLGLVARDLDARIPPASHVAGARSSQWISTTKSIDVAKRYSARDNCRVCQIDLSKVDTEIVDLSNGIPGMSSTTRLSRWAQASQEVLVRDFIPSEAIINVWLPATMR